MKDIVEDVKGRNGLEHNKELEQEGKSFASILDSSSRSASKPLVVYVS